MSKRLKCGTKLTCTLAGILSRSSSSSPLCFLTCPSDGEERCKHHHPPNNQSPPLLLTSQLCKHSFQLYPPYHMYHLPLHSASRHFFMYHTSLPHTLCPCPFCWQLQAPSSLPTEHHGHAHCAESLVVAHTSSGPSSASGPSSPVPMSH